MVWTARRRRNLGMCSGQNGCLSAGNAAYPRALTRPSPGRPRPRPRVGDRVRPPVFPRPRRWRVFLNFLLSLSFNTNPPPLPCLRIRLPLPRLPLSFPLLRSTSLSSAALSSSSSPHLLSLGFGAKMTSSPTWRLDFLAVRGAAAGRRRPPPPNAARRRPTAPYAARALRPDRRWHAVRTDLPRTRA